MGGQNSLKIGYVVYGPPNPVSGWAVPQIDVVDYPYAGGLGISITGAPGYGKSILGDIHPLTGYNYLSEVGNDSVPASEP